MTAPLSTPRKAGALRWSVIPLVSIPLLVTCSPSTEPTQAVVGAYTATTLNVDDGARSVDVLAQGGSLTLSLAGDHSTTGRLFAPGGGDNGQDLEESLVGSWSQIGNTIRFSQNADTFVRDAAWITDGATLRTTYVQGGTIVNAILTKE